MVKSDTNYLYEPTVDWDILMSRTYSQCTREEMDQMLLLKEQVKADMREHGKTTFEFCDSIGVPKNNFDINRDSNIISKQDVQSLNHSDTRRREEDRRRMLFEKTDPAFIEMAKSRVKDKKTVLKYRQKMAAEECKKQRADKAAHERLHIASLDAAGRSEHRRQKTLQALVKKEEATRLRNINDQAMRQAYEEALTALGPADLTPEDATADNSAGEDSDEA